LNDARIRLLEDIGFDWNANENDAMWNMRFQQLANYSREHGHCNVPSRWGDNPQLGDWVATLRLEKRRREKILPTDVCPPMQREDTVPREEWEQRVKKLDSLGMD
jgi:hypothetical protein